MRRWSNFLHASVEPCRSRLLLNMDETDVHLCRDGGAGNLSLRVYCRKRHPRALSCNVPRGATRTTMTPHGSRATRACSRTTMTGWHWSAKDGSLQRQQAGCRFTLNTAE